MREEPPELGKKRQLEREWKQGAREEEAIEGGVGARAGEATIGDVAQGNTQRRPWSIGDGPSIGHEKKSHFASNLTMIMATGEAKYKRLWYKLERR